MRRRASIAIVAALTALGLAAAFLLTSQGLVAGKPLSEKDLDGSYHFSVAEVRAEGTDAVYCNAYGIMVFDGAGYAEIPDLPGLSYGFCSDGSDPVEPNSFTYEVFPDGSVILTEQGAGQNYTTHCQILDKGRLVLCDGTGGEGGTLPDDRLLWTATAGKL